MHIGALFALQFAMTHSLEDNIDNSFYLQWHITERCNLHCSHCYHEDYASRNELSTKDLLRAWDMAEAALAGWGKRAAVSITGGEPFLRAKDAVIPLIERMTSGGIVDRVDILTNGSLLDESTCQWLANTKIVRRIQVSLEGANPATNDAIRGHGTFTRTVEAIERMKAHGLSVAVMMTVSERNRIQVRALLDLCAKMGVDTFALERFMPIGNGQKDESEVLSPQDVKQVLSEAYEWALSHESPRVLLYRPLCTILAPDDPHVGAMCSVGINALTILHDGTILPCRRLPMPLGNILTDNLHEIWFESPILWQARNPKNLHGKCSSCLSVPLCRGCRAMALAMTGDWLASDPHCWLPGKEALDTPQPRLHELTKLVNPEGTEVYFAYRTDAGTTLELDRESYKLLQCLNGERSPYLDSDVCMNTEDIERVLDLAAKSGFILIS